MGSAKFIKYRNFKGHWGPLTLVPKRIVRIFPFPGCAAQEGSWTPRAAWHSLVDPLQIPCRSGVLTSSSCFLLLFFPQCPSHASSLCCRGQGRSQLRQVSSRFLWDKGAFVCSAAEGTQPAALCPHLPPHHTHPPGLQSRGGKWGRVLPGFRVQPGVWDKNPPPKKPRQKIHYPPAWGCVSGRPQAGTGTGFEQVLQCEVPWGVWGALMGWERVGSILPKLEPRNSSRCALPHTAHLFYLHILLHNQGQLDFLTAPRILSSCLRHNCTPVCFILQFFPSHFKILLFSSFC